ncbi:MAG TPA: hypothetical protein VF777_14175 [Phycisphaerales bacterium]
MLTLWDLLKPAVAPVAKSARDLLLGKPAPTRPERPQAIRSRARRPRPAPGQQSPAGPFTQSQPQAEPQLRSKRRAEVFSKPRRGDGEVGMQARYDAVVREMLVKYNVKVRKWRTSSSGVAWTITYKDGRVVRLLESPQPKGPMSMAIFLHEIGHHAIGLGTYKPRCLEEYHAWAFAIRTMEERGLNITDRVHQRMFRSLRYAVRKARRRGLKELPVELVPYAA